VTAMPSADSIVAWATAAANEWRPVAIAWHVALGIGLAALLAGRRPTRRTAAWLLTLPLVSVSAIAGLSGNPFNAVVFAIISAVAGVLAIRLPDHAIVIAPKMWAVPGAALVVFGWLYPHFVSGGWPAYLYASPFGLLPCPTLSVVIGTTLLLGGLQSFPWSAVMSVAGLMYGFIGVAGLGVRLDNALFIGAALLGASILTLVRQPRRAHP
jgi:hypothetical protein